MEQAREEVREQTHCSECNGTDGHHYPNCGALAENPHDERNPAEGNNELPPATSRSQERRHAAQGVSAKEFDGDMKLPPTLTDFASNDLLWLVAKTCHEVNRAFCAEVMADHSHLPWEDTQPELRASIYEGVVMHFENSELTPEDSHRAWMEYKIKEGWKFGNIKDVAAKTHPCLLPYHQLHQHDRAKDSLFAAVCKAMFGE